MPKLRYQIAHIMPWSSVGGTEHGTLRIAQATKGEEFQHIAFHVEEASAIREMFSSAGFETAAYHAFEPSYRHPGAFLRNSFQLAREFRRKKIDLIHCADLLAAYHVGLAGRLARLPVLCHIRCRFDKLSRRDKSFLKTVNKFVFVSHDAWRNFAYLVPLQRGVVLYDGIEISDAIVEDRETTMSVRHEFGIPASAKVIGMVARVAPAKDYPTLAKAAARIITVERDVRFLIVGDHSQVSNNREHYEEVKRMLADCGVSPYFIFTDHRDDVTRMISAMDIFVLSTHTEGLPLVILEAMAQAKPVVATAVGGIPEIVKDGETGLLYPHGDDALFAEQLLSLLQNESRAANLGTAARQFVKTNFTKERFGMEITNVYREMLGRQPYGAEIRQLERPLKHSGEIS